MCVTKTSKTGVTLIVRQKVKLDTEYVRTNKEQQKTVEVDQKKMYYRKGKEKKIRAYT